MKTIKFFSFVMLLSLAWVACKDNTAATTEATTETAEKLSAEVLATNKTTTTENLTSMATVVATKITETETALASAKDATKAELTTKLEALKKFQADLQAVTAKVGEATIENWSTVAVEVEALHASIKVALAGNGAHSGSLTN
jgi:hypothetical protein